MSKKIIRQNYRVSVEPRRLGDFGSVSMPDDFFCSGEEDRQRQYRSRCEEIVSEIRRHVENVDSALVECDEVAVCAHCGHDWTEPGEYNGGCCQADEDAESARKSVSA